MEQNTNVTVTEPNPEPAATAQLSEDRKREIRAMSAAQIETRRAEIKDAIPNADTATLDAFTVRQKWKPEIGEMLKNTRKPPITAVKTDKRDSPACAGKTPLA